MQLVNIGFGNLVSAERVIAIVGPESAPISIGFKFLFSQISIRKRLSLFYFARRV